MEHTWYNVALPDGRWVMQNSVGGYADTDLTYSKEHAGAWMEYTAREIARGYGARLVPCPAPIVDELEPPKSSFLLAWLKLVAAVFGLAYLVGCFVGVSFNIADWPEPLRIHIALGAVVCVFFASFPLAVNRL